MKNLKEIHELIRNFNNDPNVMMLKHDYGSKSFMDILGVSRDEKAHSNFLAWLFDAENNDGLGAYPLKLFLELLYRTDNNKIPTSIPSENIIVRNLNISNVTIEREKPIYDRSRRNKNGLIDLVINFDIDSNKYAIVLENKIKSSENIESKEEKEGQQWQTDKYYEYFNNKKAKNESDMEYMYVFLSPKSSNGVVRANNKNFISISYDDLVDSVLDPLTRSMDLNPSVDLYLNEYIKILHKPNYSNVSKSDIVIAIPNNEKSLLEIIDMDHAELKDTLLNRKNYKDDEEIYSVLNLFLDDNKSIITTIWSDLSRRNRAKNRTFKELGIEKNTILYLAKSELNNERDVKNIRVKVIDTKNMVEFLDNNYLPTNISKAAQLLKGSSEKNGFRYFVVERLVNGKKEDINLFNIPRNY